MLAGAAELGLVRGKLQSRTGGSARRSRFFVSGRGVPDPRAERLVLPALRVPAPPGGLDSSSARCSRARAFRPRWSASGTRASRYARRRLGAASTPTATWRRSSVTSRRSPGSRTGEEAARRRLLVALALPAGAFAHATLIRLDVPSYRQRLERSPALVWLRFDQSVKALPNSIGVSTRQGRVLSGRRSRARTTVIDVPVSRLPRGAYTVRWHVISGDGHVVSGVYTFGVRDEAPPPTEAYGAAGRRRASTSSAGRTSWRSRCSSAGSGSGCSSCAGRSAGGASGASTAAGPRRRRRARGRDRRLHPARRGRAAAPVRAAALRRPVADRSGTSFGEAFIAMTLGFALVAALLFLAWLTDRRWLLWPAFCSRSGSRRASRCRGTRPPTRARRGCPSSRTGCTSPRRALWVGGLVQLAFVVWPLGAGAAAAGVPPLRAAGPVLIACCSPPAST